jgi:hypothetical protein
MAGCIGIGCKVIYEPVLLDAGPLPPGSWDIILETGIGVDMVVRSQMDEILLIQSA